MKFLLVVAAAALGIPANANAQYTGQYGYGQYGYGQYGGGYAGVSDWDYGGNRYALFEREYRHTIEGIRHGLSDGTFSRWQADRFFRELEGIRYDAMRSMRYGSYQDRLVQARMARLHARMHFKHERNHERFDGYSSYGNYGAYQPNYHDHDDD